MMLRRPYGAGGPGRIKWNAGVVNAIYVDQTAGLDVNDGLTAATPKKTLSAGIGAASPGWTLFLKRGETWFEDLWVTQPSITVKPYGSGANPLINGSLGTRSGIVVQADGVVIEDIDTTACGNGIYVTGAGAAASIYRGTHTGNGTAIVAGGGGRLVLVTGSVCQNANHSYGAGDGIQISQDASTGTHTISGVVCTGNAIAGINHKAGNCNVNGATLTGNGEPGYLVQNDALTFTIADSLIEGNNTSNNGTFNVAIENTAAVVSRRNLYRNPVGGTGGTNNINMVGATSFTSEADVFVTSSAITKFGAHVRNNTGAFAASISLTNCSFYMIGGDGACVDCDGATGMTGLTIRNCAFYSSAQRCVRVPDAVPLTMDYNDWYRADGNEFFEINNLRYYFSLASLQSNEGTDANSKLANPLYTSPTTSPPNMTPQAGSPLIGAGFNYGVTTKYGGGSFTSPPNIGAL